MKQPCYALLFWGGLLFTLGACGSVERDDATPDSFSATFTAESLANQSLNQLRQALSAAGYQEFQVEMIHQNILATLDFQRDDAENLALILPQVLRGAMTALGDPEIAITHTAERMSVINICIMSLMDFMNEAFFYKISANQRQASTAAGLSTQYAETLRQLSLTVVAYADEAGIAVPEVTGAVREFMKTLMENLEYAAVADEEIQVIVQSVTAGASQGLKETGVTQEAMAEGLTMITSGTISGLQAAGWASQQLAVLETSVTSGLTAGLESAGIETQQIEIFLQPLGNGGFEAMANTSFVSTPAANAVATTAETVTSFAAKPVANTTVTGLPNSETLTKQAGTLVAISITPTNPAIANGTVKQLAATGLYADGTTTSLTQQVTWSVTDAAIAVFSSSEVKGQVSGLSPGTTTVTAMLATLQGQTQLTVTDAQLLSIAITPTALAIAKGTSQALTAVGTFSDNTTQNLTALVTWDAYDSGIVKLGADPEKPWLARGIALGETFVSAKFKEISGNTLVKVTEASLLSLTITPAHAALAKGTRQQFTATGTFSDDTTQNLTNLVTWYSSKPAIVSIGTSSGVAQGMLKGQATISSVYQKWEASTTLTITDAVLTEIVVKPLVVSLAKGTQKNFTATGLFSDQTTQDLTALVSWSSAAETISTMSNASDTRGQAAGLNVGTTTIQALLQGIKGTASLTVTKAELVALALAPTHPVKAKGGSQQFTATGTYTDGSTQNLTNAVTWNSSISYFAAISNAAESKGLATTSLNGETIISAVLGNLSAATTFSITAATLAAIAIAPADPVIAVGQNYQFIAIGTYTDNSIQNLSSQVTWSSSHESKALISNGSSQGLASGLSPGIVTINATFNNLYGSTTLTISN